MNPAFRPQEVIDDCSESRALIKRDYTLETALTDARFYRAYPEVQIDAQHAKRVIETLLTAPILQIEGKHAKRVIEILLSAFERKGG